MVIFGYVMPDVADKQTRLVHPVGSEVDPKSGRVVEDMSDGWHRPEEHESHPASAGAAGEK
jgi:hypothetical protein